MLWSKWTLRQLYCLYAKLEVKRIGAKRLRRIQQAVNRYCRDHGYKTEEINANGDAKYDVDLGDVTFDRLDAFASGLPASWAKVEISCLRCLLAFAVKKRYIVANPAEGIKRTLTIAEKEEIGRKDITIDSEEEVQIALDIAAAFPGGASGKAGGLLWMVVMR